ncbi:MAG TPA: hypothetical protein VKZ53_12785 [Candidatus Angelobacter sp.]|nr:hypothetical protein [Candidatus Angelobacter sp.]
MQRVFLIVYVVFCIELGIVLVALPWSELWSNNSFLSRWPVLGHALHHGFARGAISGLGLLDLWLGIAEVVRYRDRR